MLIPITIKPSEFNGIIKEENLNLYIDGKYNELLDGFKKAVHKYNTSVVFIFDGRSGMGKTTLAVQSGITLDPDFGLHKIHFSPKTFLEGGNGKVGLSNAKKGDFILFDEAMIISNRSAMSQINKMIIQAMSMIRSKNIYVGFCVNSIFDLDKNLVLHRADALFHVYGETLITRGRFAAFFRGKDGIDRLKGLYLNGRKYYSYDKPRSNFVGRFTKRFIIDETLYEAQKQLGITEFLGNSGSNNKRDKEHHKIVVNLKQKGMMTKDIAEIVNLSRVQIWNILKEYQKTHENAENLVKVKVKNSL